MTVAKMHAFLPPPGPEKLSQGDFQVLAFQYRKVVEEFIPAFEGLLFIHSLDELKSCRLPSQLKRSMEICLQSRIAEKFENCCFQESIVVLLPLEKAPVFVVANGVDSYFSANVASDWLQQLSARLMEKFLVLKKIAIDFETGLANARHFFATLSHLTADHSPSVMLIEVYPRANSAAEAKVHRARVIKSLHGCLNGKLPFFYLGDDVFALISATLEEKTLLKLGQSVLSWLRKDRFPRAHLGFCCRRARGRENGPASLLLPLDEAWCALQHARKRGPYSLCNFELLTHPEKHPLCRPSPSLTAQLRRRWSSLEAFTLVVFQSPGRDELDVLAGRFAGLHPVADGDGLYVIREEKDANSSLAWATQALKDIGLAAVKVGVASYPQGKFSKSTTVINCRKALCHAAFFGENGAAVFDATSLNISGDIYYAEGDLTSAVKEYKKGLDCNSGDVNLYNSLGVACADMNRHKEAHIYFKKALSLDPCNFMALYNLGLGEEMTGNPENALSYFENALDNTAEVDPSVRSDIHLQLGKLYCLTGKYEKAAKMLFSWYEGNEESRRRGQALSFMGRALYGTGNLAEAMVWLQRALQFDEFDAQSMGLLGMVYLQRREGDEIALSLCAKSVDIDPENIGLRFFLARVQIACGRYEEARLTLKNCLRKKAGRGEGRLLVCLSYHRQGAYGRARYWLDKIMDNPEADPEVQAQALKIKEEIDEMER